MIVENESILEISRLKGDLIEIYIFLRGFGSVDVRELSITGGSWSF